MTTSIKPITTTCMLFQVKGLKHTYKLRITGNLARVSICDGYQTQEQDLNIEKYIEELDLILELKASELITLTNAIKGKGFLYSRYSLPSTIALAQEYQCKDLGALAARDPQSHRLYHLCDNLFDTRSMNKYTGKYNTINDTFQSKWQESVRHPFICDAFARIVQDNIKPEPGSPRLKSEIQWG